MPQRHSFHYGCPTCDILAVAEDVMAAEWYRDDWDVDRTRAMAIIVARLEQG